MGFSLVGIEYSLKKERGGFLQSAWRSECRQRRERLKNLYPEGIFLFPSTEKHFRNSDVLHPYRAESFLFYFTAWEQPDSLLVLSPEGSTLFTAERDAHQELWEGPMPGLEGAKALGIDRVLPWGEFEKELPSLLNKHPDWFYHWGSASVLDRFFSKFLGSFQGRKDYHLRDSWRAAGELRLFKSEIEKAVMKESCSISATMHRELMSWVKPGMSEKAVEGWIEAFLKAHGCERLAYPSIVAGGMHATFLHYHRNHSLLKGSELLLVDAGGEWNGYAADITRTFPLGEDWTEAQGQLYDLVLLAQQQAFKKIQKGHSLADLHQAVRETFAEGLLKLGFWNASDSVEKILSEQLDRSYYPHGTSHWLGMDVHDVGQGRDSKNRPRPLEPGMVFTVEPGLYIPLEDLQAPEVFRGIGIRIEDDLCLTEEGYENWTFFAPKEREEVCSLRRRALSS